MACACIVSLTWPMVPPRTHPVAIEYYRVEYTTPYRTPAGERFLGQAILIVTVGAAVNQDGHGSASGVKRVRDALARERAICAELGKVREF